MEAFVFSSPSALLFGLHRCLDFARCLRLCLDRLRTNPEQKLEEDAEAFRELLQRNEVWRLGAYSCLDARCLRILSHDDDVYYYICWRLKFLPDEERMPCLTSKAHPEL